MNKLGSLSAGTKKKITNDWLKAFPSLRVFKPMWLLKRHGPLLVGVVLDRTRSNDVYLPKFHVHNLLVPSPAILLSLVYPVPDSRQAKMPRQIKVSRHADEYPAAVTFLKQAVPELESVVLTWPQLVDLHCNFVRQKRDYAVAKFCSGVFADVILLAHWCGHSDYADRCLQEAIHLMQQWRSPIDVMAWRGTVELLARHDSMEKTLDAEIVKHKLQHIPACELNAGGEARSITQVYAEVWT